MVFVYSILRSYKQQTSLYNLCENLCRMRKFFYTIIHLSIKFSQILRFNIQQKLWLFYLNRPEKDLSTCHSSSEQGGGFQ